MNGHEIVNGGGCGRATPASSGDDEPASDPILPHPQKILDHLKNASLREEGLARALILTMLSVSSVSILPSIASRFEIEASLISLFCFGDSYRFLLILLSSEMVERMYNGG